MEPAERLARKLVRSLWAEVMSLELSAEPISESSLVKELVEDEEDDEVEDVEEVLDASDVEEVEEEEAEPRRLVRES
jgi:phage terminase small subunit